MLKYMPYQSICAMPTYENQLSFGYLCLQELAKSSQSSKLSQKSIPKGYSCQSYLRCIVAPNTIVLRAKPDMPAKLYFIRHRSLAISHQTWTIGLIKLKICHLDCPKKRRFKVPRLQVKGCIISAILFFFLC